VNKEQKNLLTPNQFTSLLFIFVLGGANILQLPNVLVKISGQDAWISLIIGSIYPLYIFFIATIFTKKHPKETILSLNKKYWGSVLGTILNFILMLQALLRMIFIVSNLILLLRVFVVGFLSPLKVLILIMCLAAYGAYNGLKVLGKTSYLISYIFIMLMILSISALKYGSLLNLQPVFSSSMIKIFDTSKTATSAYYGYEVLLLFYPFIDDPKYIKKSILKSFGFCLIIYLWVVFSTIFYLGVDIIPKSTFSFVLVFESIHIPIINNFRFVFMFIWILISLASLSNYYYTVALVINDFVKIDLKKIIIFIYPIIIFLFVKLSNIPINKIIIEYIVPFSIFFNIFLFSIMALLIKLKKR
jgi:spore germination protein (amino acid permease)